MTVLLDKGTFESNFLADLPVIMFTIPEADYLRISSEMLWGFIHDAIL